VKWLRGKLTQEVVGRLFGVHQSHVSHIQLGRVWTEPLMCGN
jgi:predicted XRE-type DNA-binding protein